MREITTILGLSQLSYLHSTGQTVPRRSGHHPLRFYLVPSLVYMFHHHLESHPLDFTIAGPKQDAVRQMLQYPPQETRGTP